MKEFMLMKSKKHFGVSDYVFVFDDTGQPELGIVVKERVKLDCIESNTISLDNALDLFNNKDYDVSIVFEFGAFHNFIARM